MPEITFLHPDGSTQIVDAPIGVSLMKAALADDVNGVLAECGGCCMCATCHVHLDVSTTADPAAAAEAAGVITEDEEELLDCTACPRDGLSRLSCQIVVTDALAGATVRVPDAQI